MITSNVTQVFREKLTKLMAEEMEKTGRRKKYRDERILHEEEVDILVEFFRKTFEDTRLDVLEEFKGVLGDIKVKS